MGKFEGGFLRIFQTFLYTITFCCAAIILGIYSYFLARLSHNHLPIANSKRAVEGIGGAGVLYLIFAVLLTCFLGGMSFFAALAICLDILFVGGFIAIAVLTRSGASSCKGFVNTPLGNGPTDSSSSSYGANNFGLGSAPTTNYSPNLGLACRMNTAVFAVSIIGAFLFLIAAFVQVALLRNHKKEKAYGPSPANNYTSGSGKKSFFSRKKNQNNTNGFNDNTHDNHLKRDAELGAVGAAGLAAHHHNNNNTTNGNTHETMRPSHDTGYTGSTVTGQHLGNKEYDTAPNGAAANTNGQHQGLAQRVMGNITNHGNHAPHGSHGGYYTQPQGTGANPYGYDNTTTAAKNY